jgi:hypothetical protein
MFSIIMAEILGKRVPFVIRPCTIARWRAALPVPVCERKPQSKSIVQVFKFYRDEGRMKSTNHFVEPLSDMLRSSQ